MEAGACRLYARSQCCAAVAPPCALLPAAHFSVRCQSNFGLALAQHERILEPLKHMHLFKSSLAEVERGVLLYGPPGTGKTMLAKVLRGGPLYNFTVCGACTEVQFTWWEEFSSLLISLLSRADIMVLPVGWVQLQVTEAVVGWASDVVHLLCNIRMQAWVCLQALARESKMNFVIVSPSQLLSKYYGRWASGGLIAF